MPHLQIDGVNIVEINVAEAGTLKRQVERATNIWLKGIRIEERNPHPDPRNDEITWESGKITVVIHYETELGPD
jgi:hypothetical protein